MLSTVRLSMLSGLMLQLFPLTLVVECSSLWLYFSDLPGLVFGLCFESIFSFLWEGPMWYLRESEELEALEGEDISGGELDPHLRRCC